MEVPILAVSAVTDMRVFAVFVNLCVAIAAGSMTNIGAKVPEC